MRSQLVALVVVLQFACTGVGWSQGSTEPYRPQLFFDQVIPKPTGKNGYEELVLAADLTRASKAFNDLQQAPAPGPTLSAIRKVLQERDLLRARVLMRVGLSKPVGSPRTHIDDETLLPEFAGFRNLARMLAFQLYVDFADGRMSRAIGTLRDSLRLGYVIQTDSLISGLVGIAIDMIAIRRMQDHLEQLSAPDCDQLLNVVREWMRQPDPSIALMNAERQGMLTMFRKYRANPEKLVEQLTPDEDSDERKQANAMLAQYRANPGASSAVFDQAAGIANRYFDRLIGELRKPYWERQQIPPIEDGSVGGMLCGLLTPAVAQVTDRYVREQAEVQLLGVYAAVRRYQWEHQQVPPSLAVLGLGNLALDPFTGKPFNYKIVSPREFELGSIGPIDTRSDSETKGQRTPLTLPMKRP